MNNPQAFPRPSEPVLRQTREWEQRLDRILREVQELRTDMLACGQYPGQELSQAMLLLHWARATSPMRLQQPPKPSPLS